MGENMKLFRDAIDKCQSQFDLLIHCLYSTLRQPHLAKYFNICKTFNSINLDSSTIDISVCDAGEPLIFCNGGNAYHAYSLLFEKIHPSLSIHQYNYFFPKTCDWDISLSLRHDINIHEFIQNMKRSFIFWMKKNLSNEILMHFDEIDSPKYRTDETIIYKENKYYLIYREDREKLFFRLNLRKQNHCCHIIDLIFWKYNQISSDVTLSELENKMLVLKHNKLHYYLPHPKRLLQTNLISLEKRKDFGKCSQDYLRMKYLINTINKILDMKDINVSDDVIKFIKSIDTDTYQKYVINNPKYIMLDHLHIDKDIRKQAKNEAHESILTLTLHDLSNIFKNKLFKFFSINII
jgi:hypothetical protein